MNRVGLSGRLIEDPRSLADDEVANALLSFGRNNATIKVIATNPAAARELRNFGKGDAVIVIGELIGADSKLAILAQNVRAFVHGVAQPDPFFFGKRNRFHDVKRASETSDTRADSAIRRHEHDPAG